LQVLATFVGKFCGAGWREEGLAEGVLEEVARTWKRGDGGVLVDGSDGLKAILKDLEGSISGGRLRRGDSARRGESSAFEAAENTSNALEEFRRRPGGLGREDSQSSLGMSSLDVGDKEEHGNDARKWLKVIDAFDQPRLAYNVGKKHFEK
jgi:DNA polymerase epsilon subunit 2